MCSILKQTQWVGNRNKCDGYEILTFWCINLNSTFFFPFSIFIVVLDFRCRFFSLDILPPTHKILTFFHALSTGKCNWKWEKEIERFSSWDWAHILRRHLPIRVWTKIYFTLYARLTQKSLRFYASHKFRNQLLTKAKCIFSLKIYGKSCFVENF